jgi:hypothetical protein
VRAARTIVTLTTELPTDLEEGYQHLVLRTDQQLAYNETARRELESTLRERRTSPQLWQALARSRR